MATSVLMSDRHVPEPPEHASYLADRLRGDSLHDVGANLYPVTI